MAFRFLILKVNGSRTTITTLVWIFLRKNAATEKIAVQLTIKKNVSGLQGI